MLTLMRHWRGIGFGLGMCLGMDLGPDLDLGVGLSLGMASMFWVWLVLVLALRYVARRSVACCGAVCRGVSQQSGTPVA